MQPTRMRIGRTCISSFSWPCSSSFFFLQILFVGPVREWEFKFRCWLLRCSSRVSIYIANLLTQMFSSRSYSSALLWQVAEASSDRPKLGRFRTASIGISKTESKRRQAKHVFCGNSWGGLVHFAPAVMGFGVDSSFAASSSRRIKVLLGSFLSQRSQRPNRRVSMAFAFAVAPVRR